MSHFGCFLKIRVVRFLASNKLENNLENKINVVCRSRAVNFEYVFRTAYHS